MGYERILVALETGDEAAEILDSVENVTSLEGSSVSILHVIRPLAGFYLELGYVLNAEAKRKKLAQEWLEELAAARGIDPDKIDVLLGTPATEIWRRAGQMDADVIVMGTHGRHGSGKILGSTTDGVCNSAPCDVLTVRV